MLGTNKVKVLLIAVACTVVGAIGAFAFSMTNNAQESLEDNKDDIVEATINSESEKESEEATEEVSPTQEVNESVKPTEIQKEDKKGTALPTKNSSSNNVISKNTGIALKDNKNSSTKKTEKTTGWTKIVCKDLRFAIEIPKYMEGRIKLTNTESDYDEEFDCGIEYASFSAIDGKCKMWVYQINRQNKIISKKDFEAKNDFLVYLGTYDGYTYSCTYASEVTEEEMKYFGKYLDSEDSNLKKHFIYTK